MITDGIPGVSALAANPTELSLGTPRLTLVLGGARSGKSALAERLVRARGERPLYLATAPEPPDNETADPEMVARIARHRTDRARYDWTTIEAGCELAGALDAHARDPARPILVDCLVLWLGTLMIDRFDAVEASEEDKAKAAVDIEGAAFSALEAALDTAVSPIVLVSGEVGMGVVPITPLGRAFQDALGRLNQRMAARADRVILCVAGLPMLLKDET